MTSILRRPPIRHLLTKPSTPKGLRRTYTPAPTSTSGPILTRRSDRALPPLNSINNPFRIWRHMPLVAVILVVGGAAIFNYEKLNHSVVSSSLYALRVHPRAREELGEEIYFANRIPWIAGSIDPMHGVIDVSFGVKGTREKGRMRFRATSRRKGEFFQTEVWTLEMGSGEVIDLLEGEEVDPIARTEFVDDGSLAASKS